MTVTYAHPAEISSPPALKLPSNSLDQFSKLNQFSQIQQLSSVQFSSISSAGQEKTNCRLHPNIDKHRVEISNIGDKFRIFPL